MANKLRILVCQHFYREAQALAHEDFMKDIVLGTYPDICIHPQATTYPAPLAPADAAEEQTHTILVGVCYLNTLALAPLISKAQHVHHLDSCFHMLAGHALVDQYVRDGAYLLTPGWLEHWERHIAQWGFDQPTARAFFQECCSQLV